MISSVVTLVEEHDKIPHGMVVIQTPSEDQQIEVVDDFGNKHKIKKHIVMTELTMWALLGAVKQPNVCELISKHLPAVVGEIKVVDV